MWVQKHKIEAAAEAQETGASNGGEKNPNRVIIPVVEDPVDPFEIKSSEENVEIKEVS